MSDLCIKAGQSVMKHGSDELQTAMRVVLSVLGHEIARSLGPSSPAKTAPFRTARRAH